ncbi:ImuA family protein [Sneathiella chinensis]|uniref:ImuA family protein n=1 Tax=Sneathiella chinensis TaxID=349750 RepID=UPI00146CF364|nr:inducible mutagenesis protein A [Sneathiella chinensis]
MDAALPKGEIAAGAVHEFIPASRDDFPAALGFMLCLLRRLTMQEALQDAPILWCHVQGRAEFPSLPYLPGLAFSGTPVPRFLTVSARLEKDMLWALEEGLSMTRSPLIIGVNAGTEKLYDFTASRRLSLRASRHGSRLFLLRPHTAATGSDQGRTTTAATRWQISPRPSSPVKYRNSHTPAMGFPRWSITLTRSKGGKTGTWILEWDHETFSFHLASPLADRKPPARSQQPNPAAITPRTERRRQTGS